MSMNSADAITLVPLIAATTLLVFAAFGWYVLHGGAHETRTVAAMILRSSVWVVLAWLARWRLGWRD